MSERENVRRQVFGTLLLSAIMRWESFFTLLMTAILYIAAPQPEIFGVLLPGWIWLVLGGAAEGALIWATLTDPEETEKALAEEFESQFDLSKVRNNVSRDRLRSAMEYRRSIIQQIQTKRGSTRKNLQHTLEDINDWISHMYDLAKHIDSFENNQLVLQDLRSVPQKIEKVKMRIEREDDEQVRQELERQLHQLEQQRRNLEATQNSVKRAEIQLESTLTSLGTVYAQISLMSTKSEVDGSREQRLRLEIQDEVNNLQDTIDALDEVQAHSLSRM